MTLRIGYRVRQFLAALNLRRESIDKAAFEAYLSKAQIELFQRMPASEQRHGLAVLHTLEKKGYSDAALAQAALLHDVGKTGGQVRLWHRVAAVLLPAVHPTLLHRIAHDRPGSWHYPFYIQLQHAARGATMAAQAGTDALAVALIRWHHTPPATSGLDAQGQALLAALQLADEQN